jgi:ATP synthase protein I
MSQQPDEELFVRAVRSQAQRARMQRTIGFWEGLGLVGAVGWMVCLPAVGGALAGRWLDHQHAAGNFWTLTLLLLGLVLGAASAWRHVQRELRR